MNLEEVRVIVRFRCPLLRHGGKTLFLFIGAVTSGKRQTETLFIGMTVAYQDNRGVIADLQITSQECCILLG